MRSVDVVCKRISRWKFFLAEVARNGNALQVVSLNVVLHPAANFLFSAKPALEQRLAIVFPSAGSLHHRVTFLVQFLEISREKDSVIVCRRHLV